MAPLVSHANELERLRETLEQSIEQIQESAGTRIEYKIGAMIEAPRAALTADEIAEFAEFFSCGTNDLTQTTFAMSRDDAEAKFLLRYVEEGILPENPFQVVDRFGVGKLVRMACDLGRKARPGMTIGVCGEHGGDPSSIQLFHEIGLDYVSCSPHRVPVARLAAAQAAIRDADTAA
jgi:pyruvate,orthophosphate dikinase